MGLRFRVWRQGFPVMKVEDRFRKISKFRPVTAEELTHYGFRVSGFSNAYFRVSGSAKGFEFKQKVQIKKFKGLVRVAWSLRFKFSGLAPGFLHLSVFSLRHSTPVFSVIK